MKHLVILALAGFLSACNARDAEIAIALLDGIAAGMGGTTTSPSYATGSSSSSTSGGASTSARYYSATEFNHCISLRNGRFFNSCNGTLDVRWCTTSASCTRPDSSWNIAPGQSPFGIDARRWWTCPHPETRFDSQRMMCRGA